MEIASTLDPRANMFSGPKNRPEMAIKMYVRSPRQMKTIKVGHNKVGGVGLKSKFFRATCTSWRGHPPDRNSLGYK